MYSLLYFVCFLLTLTPQAPHHPLHSTLAKQGHENVKQKRQKLQPENNNTVKTKGKLVLLHV